MEELRANYKNSLAKHIMEVKGCDKKEANRIKDSINRCYIEHIALTPLKVIQMEGLLSRELFSKIAKYVLNNYEWPERLDSEIDRIVLKYRTKGELGRKKPSVKRALYTALAMGLYPEWYRRFDSVTGCQSVKTLINLVAKTLFNTFSTPPS